MAVAGFNPEFTDYRHFLTPVGAAVSIGSFAILLLHKAPEKNVNTSSNLTVTAEYHDASSMPSSADVDSSNNTEPSEDDFRPS